MPGRTGCTLTYLQWPPGKVPVCLGSLWLPRAQLGGLSSLEGWRSGAVALAEVLCVHHRVTWARMCVSGCAVGRMGPGPGCQGAMTAGEHLAQRTATWGGGGGGGHRFQGKEASPRKTVPSLRLLPLMYTSFLSGRSIGWDVGALRGGWQMTWRSASLSSPGGMALNLACRCSGLPL